MNPFKYPDAKIDRIHGPNGYATYESYRPWLRDEFSFRCIYCLKREVWEYKRGSNDLDHFVPQTTDPDKALNYDNLLYACHSCNLCKSSKIIPDPEEFLLDEFVVVTEDGKLAGLNTNAESIIEILELNAPDYIRYRQLVLNNLKNALQLEDAGTVKMILGYPNDLPELSSLKPPENTKPDGLNQSHWAKRERGELSEYY